MTEARVFTWEFKESVAWRMLNGERISALHHELQIKRSVLYRWRDAYRKEGASANLRFKVCGSSPAVSAWESAQGRFECARVAPAAPVSIRPLLLRDRESAQAPAQAGGKGRASTSTLG